MPRRLVYEGVVYGEATDESGERAARDSTFTVVLASERRNDGSTRVEITVNRDDLGAVTVGPRGELYDVAARSKELADALREQWKAAQHPLLLRLYETALAKGERSELKIALTDIVAKALLDDLRSKNFLLVDEAVLQYEFVAFRTLLGRRVAELRYSVGNVLRQSWAPPTRSDFWIDRATTTAWYFVDAEGGYGVAHYQVVEFAMRIAGKTMTARQIVSMRLNLAKSEGLQTPP
jgi:hypothetical protein